MLKLAILHEACVNGAWARFKGCRQCGYAFYDRSKNRSAAWCAMSLCGNRTKNRAYVGGSRPTRGERRDSSSACSAWLGAASRGARQVLGRAGARTSGRQ
jgi:CGNR zinc finger